MLFLTLFSHYVPPQQEHIYKLMKSDSYSRFIRSSAYQELLQAKKKVKKKKIMTQKLDECLS